jgi:hypothetical protein
MPTLSRWRSRLRLRERLLTRARRAAKLHPSKAAAALVKRRERRAQHVRRMVRRSRLVNTVAFDGVPVFQGLALMLTDARDHGWNGGLNSADRRKGVAERYGRMSQAALYAGWIAHKLGFNPANPPGRSTHELRSDGVPYLGPIGRPLAWWQLGLDVSDPVGLVATLNRLGYPAFRPYSSPSEAHHVNLRRSPWRTLHRRKLA